ncbi:carbohydrate ABC transporter permease [Paenibacillus physcomitrellae]|uniref:ABC transporter permease n=1 Tax=Paenibacillus physcomitrellae TaxID=1619311 RepID=A0ABQ1GRW7_9BACL|nr:sugar ABC transporter permease [Paenibacillus physcomitrellae]GGA48945.1 ABC transporter permease [Paenibacillus physcomitrellae]
MSNFYRRWFWPLALPGLILFVAVVLVPFLIGLLYSFTSWRGTYFVGGSVWNSFVGWDNYARIFHSGKFLHSLVYTLEFTVIAVIIINVIALALAQMLDFVGKRVGLFRTVFFLPNLLGGLALGFIWQFIFQNVFSKILFGPSGLHIPFLMNMTQDATKNLFALVIMVTWQMAGYMMIIYVAGLNNIPKDLYEASAIDGASGVKRFRFITLPMLMPSITIVLFLSLANCLKLLDQNVALTNGAFNTSMLSLQILRTVRFTQPPDYGQAQAQAVVFFVLVAVIGLIQVYITKKREVEA